MRFLREWLRTSVSRAVLEVAEDFDARLEACEALLSRLSASQKRSRLQSLRPPALSNEELLAALGGTNPGLNSMSEADDKTPTHAKIARQIRRH